jgi:7-carboxy-7-deazaguanine synthase
MTTKSIPEKRLRVTELFHSIQGESTWAGLPCVFIRLTGCNLRCNWCDTAYAFSGGTMMDLDSILSSVAAYRTPLVEITGGEPLTQPACPALAESLLDAGHTVLLETGGSLPINTLPDEVIRIMDLKCPGSGECKKNHWPNIGYLRHDRDEVKFVIADRADYEWARQTIETHCLETRCRALLFSPVTGSLEPAHLAQWILEDRLPVRLQIQLHKILWPGQNRGV